MDRALWATIVVTDASASVSFLPQMTLLDLYELGQDEMSASYSTFLRVFNAKWKGALKFRQDTQYTKCNDCTRYKVFMRLACNETDLKSATLAYQNHLREVFKDRGSDSKLALISEKICRGELAVEHTSSWQAQNANIWQGCFMRFSMVYHGSNQEF